jgi:low affinity Fe/Cu permease
MGGSRKAGPQAKPDPAGSLAAPPPSTPGPARASDLRLLDRAAAGVERWAASSWGIGSAVAGLILWLAWGPAAGFSETWQLVVNTGTTIVTFLMVFLLHRAQNRQARATQLKLDELVAAVEGASNRLVASENLSEAELERLEAQAAALAERAAELREARSITDENPPETRDTAR